MTGGDVIYHWLFQAKVHIHLTRNRNLKCFSNRDLGRIMRQSGFRRKSYHPFTHYKTR